MSISTGADAAVLKRGKAQNSTSAIQNIPPIVVSSVNLGYATDVEFNPNLYRDGGGGGLINGINVIVFSDTWTNGTDNSFWHNTIAYMGIVRYTMSNRVL